MVETRHSPAIEPVLFANPRHPGLGFEVLPLAELRARVPQRHRRQHSRPDFHQVMVVEAGSAAHEVDFERHRCRPGTVLHLRPGQVQRFVRDAGAQGWMLLFRPDFLPPGALVETRAMPSTAVTLAKAQRPTVGLGVRAIAAAYATSDGGPVSARVLQHLLLALLLTVERAHEAEHADAVEPPAGLRRVHGRFVQELEQRFAATRAVGAYARRIGCSTKTLARACEAMAGTSPKRLIERRVALEAKRLLAHSSLGVSAIALELGFSEATNFVKFFRRCEGVAPSVFRARATRDPLPHGFKRSKPVGSPHNSETASYREPRTPPR